MSKKKRILIDATGGKRWIGGLYYKKNILFSLLQNAAICKAYDFVVATEVENYPMFADFGNRIVMVETKETAHRRKQLEILWISLRHRCQFVFPATNKLLHLLGKTDIHWIADFQHNRLPHFFSDGERNVKSLTYQAVAGDASPVVLSSEDCLKDFAEYYHPEKKNIHVVHFVSYIENEVSSLTEEKEKAVLEKYGLYGKRYACIMNQFWQHKNHLVVLQAMKAYFRNNGDIDFTFAFTGTLEDYRSPEYIDKLKAVFTEKEVMDHSVLLGFIQRDEQIIIMKNAEYVIQPSLFEGWGTVVEDAKVLDKRILLSDIPVHREQMNENCLLFDPHDPADLAEKIKWAMNYRHEDDVEKGLKDMYERAKAYSEGFLQLLEDCKK